MASSASARMKALVVSRLLLGDIDDWQTFEQERDTATKIVNRHTARSVTAQIGRRHRVLSDGVRTFMRENFSRCEIDDLSKLCDAIPVGIGIGLRLDEFERLYIPLSHRVKISVPCYTHVCISTYGLQFEFPEHHFMADLSAGIEDLKDIHRRIEGLSLSDATLKSNRGELGPLIARERFVCRGIISAGFSLVEAFISGLFFTALELGSLGAIPCDEGFLQYARTKEKAALKDRIDRVAKFASQGSADGQSDPFRQFLDIGKRFRDAIHHTTPFERSNLEPGQRLEDLYTIKTDVAVACTLLSLGTVLRIAAWLYGSDDPGVIAQTCRSLHEDVLAYSVEQGIANPC